MKIVVLGAGIAGATAALALTKAGHEVSVYEGGSRQQGAPGWFGLAPAAMTGLDQVDMATAAAASGFEAREMRAYDTASGQVSTVPRKFDNHRWPGINLWRTNLLQALRNALHDRRIQSYYSQPLTAQELADLDADIIVGADGADSIARDTVGNTAMPMPTGQSARYGHHPEIVPELSAGVLHFWSHSGGVFGYVSDPDHGSLWFTRNTEPAGHRVGPAEAIAPIHQHAPELSALINASTISARIALRDLDPEGPWHAGTTVLIGDAAHALSPATGRGAGLAIEDAIILAKCVRDRPGAPGAAFTRYEQLRRPIAQHLYGISRTHNIGFTAPGAPPEPDLHWSRPV